MADQKYPCPKCGKTMARSSTASSGRQRWICIDGKRVNGKRKYCFSTTNPEAPATDRAGNRSKKTPVFKRTLGGAERFLVTSAQNATPVHKEFLGALETAADDMNAELIVIPLRYKNATSTWTQSQKNAEFWDKSVEPYLWNVRRSLNSNLKIMGDIKIQPTASSPLNGLEGITHGESGIFGHTKLQLRTVPTPQGKLPKIMTTTGACTVRNYTDSRAGKLGEFHHTLGACMVEVRGKEFHMRQINADKTTGAFIDLDRLYANGKVKTAPAALALALGDVHVRVADPAVIEATFGSGGLVETCRPGEVYWHDLLDGDSVNHHHDGNPFLAVHKRANGIDDAEVEVREAVEFLMRYTKGFNSYVVPSNHDDFLTRWLMRMDWREDPQNAEFYLQSALAMVRQAKDKTANAEKLSAFAYWVKQYAASRDDIVCLKNDESRTVAGIEMGMHGDRGPNGARGSIKNLRRIGVKSIIGHSHSPGIEEGAYQSGTSTRLRLGYNVGPSSWLNTHTLVYGNGKRTLINIVNGKWRLE